MLTLADVIFPAFFTPYIVQLLYPLCIIAVLVSEYFTYRILNREQAGARMLSLVLAANVASSLVGIAIAALLPSGLNQRFLQTGGGPARSIVWNRYAGFSWVVAFLVSIAVEYPVAVGITRSKPLNHAFGSVVAANLASYAGSFGTTELRSGLTRGCTGRAAVRFHEKAIICQWRRRGAAHLVVAKLVVTRLPFALVVSRAGSVHGEVRCSGAAIWPTGSARLAPSETSQSPGQGLELR